MTAQSDREHGRTQEHGGPVHDGVSLRLDNTNSHFTATGATYTVTRREPANWWHGLLLELSCRPGFGWVRYRTIARKYKIVPVRGGLIEYPLLTDQEAEDIKRRWIAAYGPDEHGNRRTPHPTVLHPERAPAPGQHRLSHAQLRDRLADYGVWAITYVAVHTAVWLFFDNPGAHALRLPIACALAIPAMLGVRKWLGYGKDDTP